MDYTKEYKNLINSNSLGDGVRMTAGIILPAIAFNYFHLLSVGIVVAVGAMCVSLADTAGPIHHRINGMAACFTIGFIVALLTGFAVPHIILLGILIPCICFIVSMIGVYGSRANAVGVAVLLIMVLTIERKNEGWFVVYNALYILAGGTWYMLMSLLLYRARPYKIPQQVLGNYIVTIADYLRTRASFYSKHINFEKSYQQMLEQQIAVQEKQNLVREILFKTRSIVTDSTNTGRVLLMIFRDSTDLFERVMTSYQDYEALHRSFENSDILNRFQHFIVEASKELDDIGLAVKSGKASNDSGLLLKHFQELHSYFEIYRDNNRTPENVESFINLRHIINGIEDIVNRIHTLHLYTTYDKKHTKKLPSASEYEKFITHTVIDAKLLKDNLSFSSNTFRHAVRISVATLCGFIVSKFLPLGHSYWILLTIIVILKPAYSLSKQRTYQRLLGTVAGAIIGVIILYFVKDDTTLFVIMLLFMVGTYSLIRTKYFTSIFLMTPYIMILFHLLSHAKTESILLDRVIDTAIGSVIAFLANFFLIPSWEKEQIKKFMVQALTENAHYFNRISNAYTGTPVTNTQYKLSRKGAFVALANLSDAFSRMLSEPKNKRENNKLIYQFVVLNHMLTSHIATLSYYATPLAEKYSSDDFRSIIATITTQFNEAIAALANDRPSTIITTADRNNTLTKQVNELMTKRRDELQQNLLETATKQTLSEFKSIVDQFNFIIQIAIDIKKTSLELMDSVQ
ncbi:MAG TPA: FUSC family membrane protein [Ferruginibacter sp.]|jgi:uncharacterized membrane protein (TIGR01666 family)|nr:FUSC family membrane protein [Ferruginibacter sp.]